MMRLAVLLALLCLPVVAAAQSTGTVSVLHADLLNGDAAFEYTATDDAGRVIPIRRSATPDERFQDGDRVLIFPPKKGVTRQKGPLAFGASGYTIEPMMQSRRPSLTPAAVGGVHKVVVLLVNYSNKANTTTADQAASTASYLRQFFFEQSYNALTMDIDIAPRVTIPLASGGCAYSTISSQADAAAAQAGINLSGYMHRIYSFPASPCAWSGLGTVGGAPARVWYNGAFTYYPLASHELGHNLGLYHSHRLECGMGPAWGPLGSGCSNVEYGDTHDVMGGGMTARFNAAQTTRLGWLTPRTVAPGTYDLLALETTPDALKIARGTDTLWIEARRNLGVLLHAQIGATSSNGIYLLNAGGQAAQVLPAGRTWSDTTGPAGSVRVNSATAMGASVTVTAGSTTPPPIDPPVPPVTPPGGSDITRTFRRTTTDVSSTGYQMKAPDGTWVPVSSLSIVVAPYQCLRVTGGTAQVRILTASTGAILKSASLANPAMNASFTQRCELTATTVNLYINGAKKLSVTR